MVLKLWNRFTSFYEKIQKGIETSPPIALIPTAFFVIVAAIIITIGQVFIHEIHPDQTQLLITHIFIYFLTVAFGLGALYFLFLGINLGRLKIKAAGKEDQRKIAEQDKKIAEDELEAARMRREVQAEGVYAEIYRQIRLRLPRIPHRILDPAIARLFESQAYRAAQNQITGSSARQTIVDAYPALTSPSEMAKTFVNEFQKRRRRRFAGFATSLFLVLALPATVLASPLGAKVNSPISCYVLCQFGTHPHSPVNKPIKLPAKPTPTKKPTPRPPHHFTSE